MFKVLVSFVAAASLITGVAVAQTPTAAQAKEKACKQEIKAKNIVNKSEKQAYLDKCLARK